MNRSDVLTSKNFEYESFTQRDDTFKKFLKKIEDIQDGQVYLLFSSLTAPFDLDGVSSSLPGLKISLSVAKNICHILLDNNLEEEEVFIAILSESLLSGLLLDSSLGNYEDGKNPDKLFYDVVSW